VILRRRPLSCCRARGRYARCRRREEADDVAGPAGAGDVDHFSSSSNSTSSPSTSTSTSQRTWSGTCSLRVLAPSCTSTWPPSASAVAIADSLSAACWRVRDSVRLTSTSDTGALRSRPDESPGRLKAARGLSVGKGADRVVTRDGCSNSGFGRSPRCSWTAAPG